MLKMMVSKMTVDLKNFVLFFSHELVEKAQFSSQTHLEISL